MPAQFVEDVLFVPSYNFGLFVKNQSVYMDYIDGFSYVEPSLHLWDEVYLIMVDDFSDVFLNLICMYFIDYFALMFMRDIGL
ncbi:hypothetical protein H671_5g14889 [Cricetulus griseus]|uniref:Uncharacterized protein n=1 Tax=Cricetulus griseus TaxID=10029 RepID=A0A061I2K3_CRIGR|nr:hypothetical protein H671_5g14889 [Cricetulus griseus]